jgi:hypothetical protein
MLVESQEIPKKFRFEEKERVRETERGRES